MKFISKIIFVMAMLGGAHVFAQTNENPEDLNLLPENYETQQNIRCRSFDAGFEEHFGGHRTCGECLQLHGQCIEQCRISPERYTCAFRGITNNGRIVYFTGRDDNLRQARREARRACRQSNVRDCQFVGCQQNNGRPRYIRHYCR